MGTTWTQKTLDLLDDGDYFVDRENPSPGMVSICIQTEMDDVDDFLQIQFENTTDNALKFNNFVANLARCAAELQDNL